MNQAFLLLISCAYISGSIPFAKIVGRFYGIDIQKHGSGNIGFANTVRVLGWKAGLVVLPADVLKGFIPVIIAQHYLTLGLAMFVALAAISGHIFPVWLRFRGGKGIATGLGVVLALSPLIGLLGAAAYTGCFLLFKKSAPSSVVAACSLPAYCVLFDHRFLAFYASLSIVAILTHRNTIADLLKGLRRQ